MDLFLGQIMRQTGKIAHLILCEEHDNGVSNRIDHLPLLRLWLWNHFEGY